MAFGFSANRATRSALRGFVPHSLIVSMALLCALLLLVVDSRPTQAGIYDADGDVTYKEYWLPHSEFKGGIDETLPGCIDTVPQGGAFYLEPVNHCPKTVRFTIPDDFSDALKIELYLDLWRNHVPPSAAFQINNGPVRQTPIGENWSRTPYILTIDKSELVRGLNVITFTDTDGAYHLHDAAFRIYFDDAHPLRDANGNPITAPQGRLLSIWADNGLVNAADGGTLQVDDDQLLFTAQVDSPAKFVEFHGYYNGYDEDNDGQFVDWHSATRNNFHPGGLTPSPVGGTMNHIGSVAVTAPGKYMTYWSLPHIINQSGVKFKIRIVDNNYVVREAAGGVSGTFTLSRSKTVQSYYNASFVDGVLYAGGNKPLTVTRTLQLPGALVLADYQEAYFLGAYWQNPNVAINGGTKFKAFSSGEDSWALSVRKISPTLLRTGSNNLIYTYSSGYGQFIEKPGGMIVLKQTTRATDNSAPVITSRSPAANASEVDPATNIVVAIKDNPGRGVAINTVRLKVNGTVVTPQITGTPDEYTLTYDPPTNFAVNTNVTIAVDACDYAGKCMTTNSYSFGIVRTKHTLEVKKVGQGTVAFTPNKQNYTFGDTVQFTPTPADGWAFANWIVDQGSVAGWWNSDWHYRLPLSVSSAGIARTERPVEVAVNFTAQLTALGESGAFDPNALRVIEVDGAGAVVDANIPFQFNPAANYQATTNAAGTLIFMMKGTTVSDGVRNYQIYFDLASRQLPPPSVTDQVIVTDGIMDEGQESFQIETANATYTFHKEGCGFASMIDINGNDWLDYHPEPENSAGAFRGLPNMVPPPDGLFHPGHLIGNASLLSSGALKESINCITYDNKWEVQWDFFPKFARMTLVRKSAAQNYWFLYEGVPGGVLETTNDKIVRSDGTVTNIGGSWTGDLAAPEWVYVYDDDVDNAATVARSLFLVHHEDDTAVDSYRPNGSGSGKMTIFGFGRDGSGNNPFMTQADQHFTIGFMDETSFGAASTVINSSYRDLIVTPAAPELRGAISGEVITTPNLTLTIQRDTVVTATFDSQLYELNLHVVGGGTVTRTPDKATYLRNEPVTIAAQAQTGWQFVGWSGDVNSTTSPLEVILNRTKEVTGTFALIEYTVAVSANGEGSVTLNPQQASYHFGDQIVITATAAAGWHFSGWSDGVGNESNVRTLTVDGDKVLQALFTQDEYTVVAQVVGDGSVEITPVQPTYHYGDLVTVTAMAAPGWRFAGWSGSASGSVPSTNVTVDGNETVIATFERIFYTVTTQALDSEGQPAGASAVQLSAPTNAGGYVLGEEVTVTAVAAPGWSFLGWSGSASGATTPTTITVDDNETVTATFAQAHYTVNVTVVDETDAVVNAATVAITPPAHAAGYVYGEEVTITLTPLDDWLFGAWTGDLESDSNPFTFPVTGNTALRAVFAKNKVKLTARVEPAAGGTITPASGSFFTKDEIITVTAIPNPGWQFAGWEGALSGNTNPATLTMNTNKTVRARFTQRFYTLEVAVGGGTPQGGVAIPSAPANGEGYLFGEQVTLTATVNSGHRFIGWSVNDPTKLPATLDLSQPVITFAIEGDLAFTANFAKLFYTVTVQRGGPAGETGGEVTISPPTDEQGYSFGEFATLTASPKAGYRFTGWSVNDPSKLPATVDLSQPVLVFEVSSDLIFTANFAPADLNILYLPFVNR